MGARGGVGGTRISLGIVPPGRVGPGDRKAVRGPAGSTGSVAKGISL